ncbi:cation:proton antiporter [Candidatus Acetothermia bacterium]|nr:MAG: cation:proton antiporter [Candidatus Acetothermia bacterium]HHK67068.1 cation:proton antiporter [Candidatus Acetothermia bacterium]
MNVGNLPFIVSALLVVLGIYTLLFKRNLIKLVIGVSLIETGVNLFLVMLGYRSEGIAPIYTFAPAGERMVLPTPQALTLTSIVIGLATTALLLSFAVFIWRHYGTLDVHKIKELKG